MNIFLIALVFIAGSGLSILGQDVQVGGRFEATPDEAAALIAAGQAEPEAAAVDPAPPPPPVIGKTKAARVLVSCQWGRPNDVVAVPVTDIKAQEAAGHVDSNPAAVAYARSLAA